jgi:hypothetical protein
MSLSPRHSIPEQFRVKFDVVGSALHVDLYIAHTLTLINKTSPLHFIVQHHDPSRILLSPPNIGQAGSNEINEITHKNKYNLGEFNKFNVIL